jgi:hypothetical protein
MTNDVTVPQLPPLATHRAVELIQVGHWELSSGPFDPTTETLYQAVAATDCPAVRSPILKLGHTDVRAAGDGEPALGWVDNLSVTDNGSTLIGDYRGMPGWFASAMTSAYPSRSIEGWHDYVCQLGHTHPFVLTAVALLGVAEPGIGTLESLNLRTIGELYGVSAESSTQDGTPFVVEFEGSGVMAGTRVTAQATVSDVTNAFYDLPAVAGSWFIWAEELFIDPAVLIACDDADGTLWEYTYEIDASGVVTFGDPTQVLRTYVAATATKHKPVAKYASAKESRPAAIAAREARKAFASSDAAGTTPVPTGPAETEEGTMEDKDLVAFRAALGTADDADAATVLGALTEALNERADDVAPVAAASTLPPGTVAVDAGVLAELQRGAADGVLARQEQERQAREALVDAAVKAGRISPAQRENWSSYLAAGSEKIREQARQELAALPENTAVHVVLAGHAQGASEAQGQDAPPRGAWVN